MGCRHPVEYHNWQAGHNPWARVLYSYIFPLNGFAILICLPKFFESTVNWETTANTKFLPEQNVTVWVSGCDVLHSPTSRFCESVSGRNFIKLKALISA
jgi:hypothetical protein